mmetsp:Transcript_64729/g.151730  ORF Transcript_64729/g.151730 Transcript_64729/m.151730 type:complete len:227 (+) Transcript_64729:37-717(+)|eukprot:s3728_g12.t2
MPRVEIKVVLDFMCPWSFIGLRSLQVARERFVEQLEFGEVEFSPFEFDPPGTYPAEGRDWTDYCRSFGPAKARFLLEDKLPRAFELGKAVGIDFRMDRRIVHTIDVNTALLVAQKHRVAEPFALEMLKMHFEELQDPNNRSSLSSCLASLGVPEDALTKALEDPGKEDRILKVTEAARARLRSGVPHFEIRCGGSRDLCEGGGSPSSPAFFEHIFQRCASAGGAEL